MKQFIVFDSPLELAFIFWQQLLSASDTVIDATVGHGYDCAKILPLIPDGFLYGIDIQNEAIESTQKKLEPYYHNFKLFRQSHDHFPKEIQSNSIKLIVYNLGYLPKSTKEIKTSATSTIQSLNEALKLLMPSGALSIMCYNGHSEGEDEKIAILDWSKKLHKTDYLVTYHEIINRDKAPALCLIQKQSKEQDV